MNRAPFTNQPQPPPSSLTQNLSEAILSQLTQEQNRQLDDAMMPELMDHIQNFFDSRKKGAKHRHTFDSKTSATAEMKKVENLSTEMHESLAKSTGRTQVTEMKKHAWNWREGEGLESDVTKTNQKEFLSRNENESMMAGEDMKGIRELQDRVENSRKLNFKKGVEIKGMVRKKNRYSVPVKRSLFQEDGLRIEEESENERESEKEEARQSERFLEQSLKKLKGHLVKEIESGRNTQVRPKVNIYSKKVDKKVKSSAYLDQMLRDTLLNDTKASKKLQLEEKNHLSFERQGCSFRKNLEEEPKTRELFYEKVKNKANPKKIRKSMSLKNRKLMPESPIKKIGFSPKFESFRFGNQTMKHSNELNRRSAGVNRVMENTVWKVTRSSGCFQKPPKKADPHSIFSRLYQRSMKQLDEQSKGT